MANHRTLTNLLLPTRVSNTTSQHWKTIKPSVPGAKIAGAESKTAGLALSRRIPLKSGILTKIAEMQVEQPAPGHLWVPVGATTFGALSGAAVFNAHLHDKLMAKIKDPVHLAKVQKKTNKLINAGVKGKLTQSQVLGGIQHLHSDKALSSLKDGIRAESKLLGRALKIGGGATGLAAGLLLKNHMDKSASAKMPKLGAIGKTFRSAFGGDVKDFVTNDLGFKHDSKHFTEFLKASKGEQLRTIRAAKEAHADLSKIPREGNKFVDKVKSGLKGTPHIPATPLSSTTPDPEKFERLLKERTKNRLKLGAGAGVVALAAHGLRGQKEEDYQGYGTY